MNHSKILVLLLALIYYTSARQIRINRDETQISGDNDIEVNATVKEINPPPYAAAGFRPSRAFPLPGEESETDLDTTTTTTTTEAAMESTTTDSMEIQETTTYNEVPAEISEDTTNTPLAPFSDNGYRNDRAFNISNENQKSDTDAVTTASSILETESTTFTSAVDSTTIKAPYPAAGYRPNRAFRLPTENSAENSNSLDAGEAKTPKPHPPCGVNDNPIAPTPPAGTQKNPNSENVPVAGTTTVIGPRFVNLNGRPILEIRSQPLTNQQPLWISYPFVYSTQLEAW